MEDKSIECFPVGDQAEIKSATQLPPKAALAECRGYGGLKQAAAALLDLVDQKRQHHQVHQNGAEVLAAVTEIVLEVVALVFEGVEGLIFDFPAGASSFHQFHEVCGGYRDVGHPGEMGDFALGCGFSQHCSQWTACEEKYPVPSKDRR